MRPKNNDKPWRNPTLPDRTLRKMCRSRSQQEPSLLLIEATREARINVILQVAQYFIMITVDGQKAKYGDAKGIVENAKLVYPWITRHQVYAKMRLLKHPQPVFI